MRHAFPRRQFPRPRRGCRRTGPASARVPHWRRAQGGGLGQVAGPVARGGVPVGERRDRQGRHAGAPGAGAQGIGGLVAGRGNGVLRHGQRLFRAHAATGGRIRPPAGAHRARVLPVDHRRLPGAIARDVAGRGPARKHAACALAAAGRGDHGGLCTAQAGLRGPSAGRDQPGGIAPDRALHAFRPGTRCGPAAGGATQARQRRATRDRPHHRAAGIAPCGRAGRRGRGQPARRELPGVPAGNTLLRGRKPAAPA